MTLQNKVKQSGFTIVELLIVVVVIAILAAITIVAYNGIQNRAKTSSGSAFAQTIGKKVEAYNTLMSSYPTYCQLVTNTASPTGSAPAAGTTGVGTCAAGGTASGTESQLASTGAITPASAAAGTGYTSTVSNGNAVVGYYLCGATTGADIYYWDYSANAIAIYKVGAGC